MNPFFLSIPRNFLFFVFFVLPFTLLAQTPRPAKPAPKPAKLTPPPARKPVATSASSLKTGLDSISYAIGVNLAQSFKQQNLGGVSGAILGQAVDNVLKGRPGALDETQCAAFLQNYFQKAQAERTREQAKQYEPVKKEGEAFLAANKTKDSVVTTASGLQYKVLKAGTGPKPTANDRVKTHYHGTLIDGKVFDSSVQRGEPISFALSGVIPGWTEALQLMPVGSKYRLFIPYQLAYGERGSMPGIPPYSTLIFEVELLDIEKKGAE